MKAFVLCGCVLACIFYISAEIIPSNLPGQREEWKDVVSSCVHEAGLTHKEGYEIQEIVDEVYKQPGMEEKRRKHGCVIECLLKSLEWMEGSEIKEDRIYGNITKLLNNHPAKEKAQQLVRNCAQQVRDATVEGCNRGFVGLACTVKNTQKWKHLINTLDVSSSEEEGEEN
ncbi:hypothetical protein X777_05295 [Ooceraea biroi]|uniref:Uncharacterized protein n=2 Tax=Ooceraea biroi TaxID=2015173 RepID=A0A026WGE9_OOCBI|nr:hypothetical protein X777_05295 [Ooceraea biroi]